MKYPILMLLVTSCFNPDYSKVRTICPSDSPVCPVGQTCISGECVAALQDLGEPVHADAGMDAGTDMSHPGCRRGGGQAVGAAAACEGTFPKGGASALCSPGWMLCKSVTMVDMVACANLVSFFAADVPAYWLGNKAMEGCGSALTQQEFYGCGLASRPGINKCGGFKQVIDVQGVWASQDGTLATAQNSDPQQGVLCCPP